MYQHTMYLITISSHHQIVNSLLTSRFTGFSRLTVGRVKLFHKPHSITRENHCLVVTRDGGQSTLVRSTGISAATTPDANLADRASSLTLADEHDAMIELTYSGVTVGKGKAVLLTSSNSSNEALITRVLSSGYVVSRLTEERIRPQHEGSEDANDCLAIITAVTSV